MKRFLEFLLHELCKVVLFALSLLLLLLFSQFFELFLLHLLLVEIYHAEVFLRCWYVYDRLGNASLNADFMLGRSLSMLWLKRLHSACSMRFESDFLLFGA